MNKDFFKGLAVGVGIAGLAAVAATAAVKALKGCCCGDCDDDFEYECCCGDCDDDTDYMALIEGWLESLQLTVQE